MDLEGLGMFLVTANLAGYASGDESNRIRESDGSTSIRYTEGPWEYHDNYDGGEPFCGRIRVSYEGRPVWSMAYYGAVQRHISVLGPIYSFLMEALSCMPEEAPFRGPRHYANDELGFVYENEWTGDLGRFQGNERIFEGRIVYSAGYLGGLVDELGFE